MAQNNGDLTAKECRAVMKYLFLKGSSTKKILSKTLEFLLNGENILLKFLQFQWSGGVRPEYLLPMSIQIR
jgi:hypothetical protein